MKLTQENINLLLDKYTKYVDSLSLKNHYESNIKHLLYLIVPAFVIKYDEQITLKCFDNIKIELSGTEDKKITASFDRTLKCMNDNYYTSKYVVINEYKTASLAGLIDNIVHEFNHAINSSNNEIVKDNDVVKLRTGLSYSYYDRKSFKRIKIDKSIYLEEVLNTEQTEEIIDIICSFHNYKIENDSFKTALYAINSLVGNKYKSSAYSFTSYICKELLNNKTFVPTINNLRFKGFVDDIPSLFDNVVGREGSYEKLVGYIYDIHELEYKYSNAKMFKNHILNKIKKKASLVMNMIKDYDNKCIYK